MTEIIGLLSVSSTDKQTPKCNYESGIKKTLSELHIESICEHDEIYFHIDLSTRRIPIASASFLDQYFLLVIVKLDRKLLKIQFKICSKSNGVQIKAESRFQKNNLIRLIENINRTQSLLIFKVHPVTGEIIGVFELYLDEEIEIHSYFKELINQILSSGHSIWAILEILELAPLHKNRLNHYIWKSMESVRCQLSNYKSTIKDSIEEEMHRKYFIAPKTAKEKGFSDNESEHRRSVEELLKKQTQKFACRRKQSVKQNYFQISLGENAFLMALTKQIVDEEVNEKKMVKKQMSQTFILNGIKKNIIFQPSVHAQREYQICENICKNRSLYLSFIYEHYYLKGYSKIHKFFTLVCEEEKKSSITLSEYFAKNSLTLSFEVKMFIFCSVLAIGNICQKLELSPALSMRNVWITRQLDLKVQRLIMMVPRNFKLILMEALYNIVFNEKLCTLRRDDEEKKINKKIFFVDQGFAKFIGPSIYITILKQILLGFQSTSELPYELINLNLPTLLKIGCAIRDLKLKCVKRHELGDLMAHFSQNRFDFFSESRNK